MALVLPKKYSNRVGSELSIEILHKNSFGQLLKLGLESEL